MDYDQLLSWWQNLTPETIAAVQNGCLLLATLWGGHFLGGMAARGLRARNFDAALRLPGGTAAAGTEHGFTPTFFAGTLIRLTVWAGVGWWLARASGRVDIAAPLGLAIGRTWMVATLLVAALALGNLLARRLIDCIAGPHASTDVASRQGPAGAHRTAGIVGAAVYFLVLLLVLLVAADFFEWPLTRSAGLALWQFAQNLMTAGAALLVGYLGARSARELVTRAVSASAEQRVGDYTALGIMSATTILAIGVLLPSGGVLITMAALAAVGLAVWLARGYLADVVAGLQLRIQKVREVWFDGVAWQVTDIGLLTSSVMRSGAVHSLQNQQVLEAHVHAAASQQPAR